VQCQLGCADMTNTKILTSLYKLPSDEQGPTEGTRDLKKASKAPTAPVVPVTKVCSYSDKAPCLMVYFCIFVQENHGVFRSQAPQ